jgi:hypothetical protein
MARLGFFGHNGPDGSRVDTRDEAAGYVDWTFLAENLAAGQTTPEQAVQAWVNSPGHLADILALHAHDTGVGFAVSPGSKYVYYWVQEFGERDSVQFTVELPPLSTSTPRSSAWPYRADNSGLDPLDTLSFNPDPRLLVASLAIPGPDREASHD